MAELRGAELPELIFLLAGKSGTAKAAFVASTPPLTTASTSLHVENSFLAPKTEALDLCNARFKLLSVFSLLVPNPNAHFTSSLELMVSVSSIVNLISRLTSKMRPLRTSLNVSEIFPSSSNTIFEMLVNASLHFSHSFTIASAALSLGHMFCKTPEHPAPGMIIFEEVSSPMFHANGASATAAANFFTFSMPNGESLSLLLSLDD
mmetsp:Transcript_4327/g.13274  ORF Transcript_4327/g.13274 Transcript_4327/m.13274 type:complete len:206 (+) Transcript_4327:43-660(+)